MNTGYDLSGSGIAMIRRYKIAETMATVGVPVEVNDTASTAGIELGTTTAQADVIGLTLDAGVYSTTQGDAEGVVSVCINPFMTYRAHISSAAAAGTQLNIITNSAANTAGTTVTITTGDVAPNSPEMDEGTLACVAGANTGQTRLITSTSATTAVVTVPFLNDIAANDVFIAFPWQNEHGAGTAYTVQLTTNLNEVRHDIAVATGADLQPVELQIDFGGTQAARLNSYLFLLPMDHVFRLNTT